MLYELHNIVKKSSDQAKEQHYSTFHGYSTSWIQANKSKITTIGKRGFTDWLFDSGGRFEQMHSSVNHLVAVKSPVNCPSNHLANTPVNRHPAVGNSEDSDELIFVSEQNTKKRRTSRDQPSSTFSDGSCVPVQKVAPMRATVRPADSAPTGRIMPQTVTPSVQTPVGKSKQKSHPKQKRCLPPLMVNYLNEESMKKYSSDIRNSLQKLLQANNLAPRN